MELRSSSLCAVLLLLLLFSASCPRLSTGRLHAEEGTEEVYEIDYRGPETHSSSFPPPHRPLPGSSLLIHRTNAGEAAHEHERTSRTKHKLQARKIHG